MCVQVVEEATDRERQVRGRVQGEEAGYVAKLWTKWEVVCEV